MVGRVSTLYVNANISNMEIRMLIFHTGQSGTIELQLMPILIVTLVL